MSAEFGQGYGSIIGGTGGGMDDRQFAGGYQSDGTVVEDFSHIEVDSLPWSKLISALGQS